MKSLLLAVAAAAFAVAPARAQDSGTSASSGSQGQSKQPRSAGSAQAEVGERAPGDAASSTSAEGRPRAGIEVGTASATQGGRTDNGTPPSRKGATDRPATAGGDQTSTDNNSANRRAQKGETEDKELNRIPDQGATMMSKEQQKKEAGAAKRRGKSRKDTSTANGKNIDVPNPAAETPAPRNRKE
jgi:hypothetical protein